MAGAYTLQSYASYGEVADADTVSYYVAQASNQPAAAYFELEESSTKTEAELVDAFGPPPAYSENTEKLSGYNLGGYAENVGGYNSTPLGAPQRENVVRWPLLTPLSLGYSAPSGYADNTSASSYASDGYVGSS